MESENVLDINIDPEEPILSISDGFRAIWARSKKMYAKTFTTPPLSPKLKSPSSYYVRHFSAIWGYLPTPYPLKEQFVICWIPERLNRSIAPANRGLGHTASMALTRISSPPCKGIHQIWTKKPEHGRGGFTKSKTGNYFRFHHSGFSCFWSQTCILDAILAHSNASNV